MPGFSIVKGQGGNNTAEFHRSHRWLIENLGMPTSDTGSSSSNGRTVVRGESATAGGPTQLAFYAQGIQLPELEFDEEQILSPSVVYKVAKRAKWKNWVVKFYDIYGLYKTFEEWQRRIWNPQDGMKAAVDYKGEPVFAMVDGTGNVKQRYTLKGAYPQSVTHGDLSYTNSEVKLLVVTYSYDYATIELMDNDNSQNSIGRTRTR